MRHETGSKHCESCGTMLVRGTERYTCDECSAEMGVVARIRDVSSRKKGEQHFCSFGCWLRGMFKDNSNSVGYLDLPSNVSFRTTGDPGITALEPFLEEVYEFMEEIGYVAARQSSD